MSAEQSGTVVVTGAGSGLGRALCVEFARRGRSVVGIGRNIATLDETRHLAGNGVRVIPLDVSDHGRVVECFAGIARDAGTISILVNNAAVYPRIDILSETPESFMRTIEINLGGYFACAHAALQQMTETGAGRIVNVGSMADLSPLPCSAAYSVSKGASRILTRALVADLSDRFPGIVISEWLPGILATTMGVPDGLDPAVAAKWGVTLASNSDPSLNGAVFEQAYELMPSRSLKRKVADKVLFRRPRPPRRLD